MNLGGDMAQMHSANDPIFWHHYPYLDYLGSLTGTYYKGRSSSNKTKLNKMKFSGWAQEHQSTNDRTERTSTLSEEFFKSQWFDQMLIWQDEKEIYKVSTLDSIIAYIS